MYVTLEPCCHYGKQPPCVNAIIESGIERVVTGSSDPNPLVSGKGIQILREHGIAVTEHILQEDCNQLNEVFFHYIHTKRPFVVMKYAMTMDGKIAVHTGLSKWVTGETARSHVAQARSKYTAIMVGVGTVLADNPLLTCRIEGGKNPIRIICDTTLCTPLHQRGFHSKTVSYHTCNLLSDKRTSQESMKKKAANIVTVQKNNGHVDLVQLMDLLGQKQIDSILLEGGGTLNWSALSCGIVQKVQAYIAPKLFGGKTSKTPIEGEGVSSPTEAFCLKNSRCLRLGDDFLIESEVEQIVHRDC